MVRADVDGTELCAEMRARFSVFSIIENDAGIHSIVPLFVCQWLTCRSFSEGSAPGADCRSLIGDAES